MLQYIYHGWCYRYEKRALISWHIYTERGALCGASERFLVSPIWSDSIFNLLISDSIHWDPCHMYYLKKLTWSQPIWFGFMMVLWKNHLLLALNNFQQLKMAKQYFNITTDDARWPTAHVSFFLQSSNLNPLNCVQSPLWSWFFFKRMFCCYSILKC